jgi:AraC-like DNA-binding protein
MSHSSDVNTATKLAGHSCRVLASPLSGVFGTEIESVRSYERHTHATYGFGLVDRGAHRSWSGRGSVEAFAGDVITTNPGEVHDGRPRDGGAVRRWRMIYVDSQTLASFLGPDRCEPGGQIQLTLPVIRDEELGRSLRVLFKRIDQWNRIETGDTSAEALACTESMTRSIALLLVRYATDAPDPAVDVNISEARERLADALIDPPSLADLAAPLGLSRFQLLRRFEQVYGLPPHKWLVQRRVEHARKLIGGGATLSDAALASGFADQSHMNRWFVTQLGFTPGAWKRAQGGARARNSVQDPR